MSEQGIPGGAAPEQVERPIPSAVPRVHRTRPARRPRATVGGVIGTSLRVWGRNLVPFLALTTLVFTPYVALLVWLQEQPFDGTWTTGWMLSVIVQHVLGSLVTGALIHGVFQELRGRRASLGEILSRGVARVPAVVVVSIVVVVCSYAPLVPGMMAIGFEAPLAGFFLVIAGLGFAAAIFSGLFIAVPASVVERPGVPGAIRRSWGLTRGYRWTVLGIVLLFYVLSWLLAAVLGAATAVISMAAVLWVQVAVSVLTTSVQAVLRGVAYHDIRVSQEGIETEELAAIFD